MTVYFEDEVVVRWRHSGREYAVGVSGNDFIGRDDEYDKAVRSLLSIAGIAISNLRGGLKINQGITHIMPRELEGK